MLLGQKEFAPLNAEWNYEGHEINCEGNHINYIVEKEEIIDGKDCSIIYAYTSNDVNPNFIKSPDSLIVWEDDHKVYFLEDSTFYLLFDFDVNVGDTVIYYEPINKSEFSTNQVVDISQGPNEYQMVVTELEIIDVSNVSLRKFYTELISPYLYLQSLIIENIGSLSQNFTGDQTIYVADGCFGGLQCYSNGQIEYENQFSFQTPNPSCNILDSTNEVDTESMIGIFPNPASTEISIESQRHIESVEIWSVDGKLLRTSQFSKSIDIEGLHPGIYFLRVGVEGRVETKKFVKE